MKIVFLNLTLKDHNDFNRKIKFECKGVSYKWKVKGSKAKERNSKTCSRTMN